MVDFNIRLVEALKLRNMKPAELSRISGISEGMISSYRHGNYKASQRNLEKLAKALNVSIPWLMGANVPITPSIPNASNIFPIERKKIPLLGKIACGQPIMSEEVFDGYVQCNGNIHADFCLRAEGDSMINARIYDGDIVFIHQQPEVENGEIAAVSIDDSVTLKRVYIEDDCIELRAENPRVKPLRYKISDFNQFRILGKAIAFQGDIV